VVISSILYGGVFRKGTTRHLIIVPPEKFVGFAQFSAPFGPDHKTASKALMAIKLMGQYVLSRLA
jgi:hypothetical protein